VARQQVHSAEKVTIQKHDDISNAESVGSTSAMPQEPVLEMLNAIGDSLSDRASSDDEEHSDDAEDDEEDRELGKLSQNDEPGWVMGTISNTVMHCLGRFAQTRMRIDELTQPRWGTLPFTCVRDI